MAIQDDFSYIPGTPLTWQDSGGTFVMTLQNLATVTGRQGPKSATLLQVPPGLSTAVMPAYLKCKLDVQMTSAPGAGTEVQLYLGFSDSATAGTDNPAGLSGTDAGGPNTDTFAQMVFVGSLVLSNSLGTANQEVTLKIIPTDLYVSPVIYNGSGVNFKNTINTAILTITPMYRVRST